MGSSQLKKLDGFVENRREITKRYNNLFSNIEFIKTPKVQNTVEYSNHLYPLQIVLRSCLSEIVVLPRSRVQDVDTTEDWENVEKLFNSINKY